MELSSYSPFNKERNEIANLCVLKTAKVSADSSPNRLSWGCTIDLVGQTRRYVLNIVGPIKFGHDYLRIRSHRASLSLSFQCNAEHDTLRTLRGVTPERATTLTVVQPKPVGSARYRRLLASVRRPTEHARR